MHNHFDAEGEIIISAAKHLLFLSTWSWTLPKLLGTEQGEIFHSPRSADPA